MIERLSAWLAGLGYQWFLLSAFVILAALFILFRAIPRTRPVTGQLMVLSGMCVMTLFFYLLTFSLLVSIMAADSGCTPRTIPRLWCFLMLLAAAAAFVAILKKDNTPDKPFGRWGLAMGVAVGSIFSVVLFQFIGYYLSSAVFIVLVMLAMQERRWKFLVITPICWTAFTYLIFAKLLYISLPIGALFELL